LLDVDARPSSRSDPAPVRDVGDGALVANKVLFVAVGEVLFEDAVEAAGFVLVAVDAILDLLGA